MEVTSTIVGHLYSSPPLCVSLKGGGRSHLRVIFRPHLRPLDEKQSGVREDDCQVVHLDVRLVLIVRSAASLTALDQLLITSAAKIIPPKTKKTCPIMPLHMNN